MKTTIKINLLSTYYVPGTIPGSNQRDKNMLSLTLYQGETICNMG